MKLALPLTSVAIAAILAACGGAGTTTTGAPISGGLGQGGTGSSQAYNGIASGAPAPADHAQSQPNTISDPVLQAQSAQKLIQDATVTIKISKGSFDSVSRRIVDIAQAAGGVLFSMQTAQSDQDVINTGTVVVKVPADQYTRILDQFRSLGTVTAIQTSSQDVSSEYVDLQARNKNQHAQQAILIALMARAQNITDSIAVQNQLSIVTGEIERIEGRIRYLDTQTTFSTISVNLIIPAVVAAKPAEPSLWDRSGIGDSFGTALRLSANVVSGMIIVLGFLLPFLVLAALGLAAWRFRPKGILTQPR
jgi:Domain of unknown function (DUF4349)